MRIPYIVEVAGNYELLQRQLGFTYYFGNFHRARVFRTPAKALSNWMLSLPIRGATRVIGRNKNNYEHAFALGADVERLSLIRIRISPGFFTRIIPAASPARDVGSRYILYVARLAPEKRPDDCIRIFEQVAARIDDVRLIMIGDGPLMPGVVRRVQTSPYAKRIQVLGALPNAEVLRWTRGAAVGLELYSGSSLVEKMSCAVPVVAYDIEWMSEVVIDGYTGYTADFLDIGGMADRCVDLLTDPELALTLGMRGRQLAETLFNRDAIIRKEDSYLRRLT
jgi:glycosyltransferase involved in cell wall biosynthesis